MSIISAAPAARTSEAVKQYLTDRGIEYEVRPRMVRGLDYYMRTTFEVVHGSLGAQNSVLGGGRYDGLAESLGSKVHSPGIGFSIGEDPQLSDEPWSRRANPPSALDLFHRRDLGEAALRQCGRTWLATCGAPDISVELLVEAKLKRAMELANKLGARFVLIIGENEMAAGRYTLKNMSTGNQQSLTREEIAARLAAA